MTGRIMTISLRRSKAAILLLALAACSEPTVFDAAADNDAAALSRMLADGVDLDSRDEKAWTPLHHAAANSAADAIRLLLEAGADPGAVAQQGFTPLHVAVVEADIGTVRLLVEAGAPLDAPALDGLTPRQLAERRGDREKAAYLAALSSP